MKTAFFALLFAAAAAMAAGPAANGRPAPIEPPRVRAPSPSPSPTATPSLSPDDIFHKAIRALRQNPDPPYITYMMHEVFVHHGRSYTYDYRVWYRTDGKGLMQDIDSTRAGRQDTYFGYPFPSAPDNNILLYATPPPSPTPLPAPQGSAAPSGATPAPLLGIEPVRSDRYYDVSLVGLENYVGHKVYHLALRAVRDEQAHPWKDLWIDTGSFQVWKAHANASGSKGPGHGSVDATAEFEHVGPYWLLARATGDGEVHIGFISDSGHYEYTFSDFGFPANVPDWFFDEKAFKKHFRS